MNHFTVCPLFIGFERTFLIIAYTKILQKTAQVDCSLKLAIHIRRFLQLGESTNLEIFQFAMTSQSAGNIRGWICAVTPRFGCSIRG